MRMTLLRAAIVPLLLGGCTLVWGPKENDIVPAPDGGVDGGDSDGGDARRDAGPDAGDSGPLCVPERESEYAADSLMGCRGGLDEDCDGLVDCFDPDCSQSLDCCAAGAAWNTANNFTGSGWTELPRGSADVSASPTEITDFGPRPRALLHERECAPLAFGLDLAVHFRIISGCAGCTDFASLALSPTTDMVDGARLTADLALVVEADGSAHLERAGERVAGTERSGLPLGSLVRAELRLRPGTYEGGAVLLATARLSYDGETVELGEPNQPFLLLEDLRGYPFCPGGGHSIAGQMVAIEGRGDHVQVQALDSGSPPVTVGGTQRTCANPSYFEPLDLRNHEASFADCPGQWGEPSILNYCLNCGATRDYPWWDLWIDTTRSSREDPLGSYPDFEICGSRTDLLTGATSWEPRTGGSEPPLLPMGSGDSAREPFVWAPPDAGASSTLQVVWAQRAGPGNPAHDVWMGELDLDDALDNFGSVRQLLAADDIPECESLRDPALMPRGEDMPADGLWLLFTCEGVGTASNSIGAAALSWEGREYALERDSVRTDLVTHTIGAYASRGAFSPEPIAEFDAGKLRVQLWFLVRSGGADVALAFASGEGPAGELPELSPYPANPILRPDDDVFGGDCPSGCRFNGLGVTRAINSRDYQMVIGRTVVGSPADTHELVPLRQRRPNL